MREYGRVYASFWTSPDIHALSDDGKLLALYLLSGPHGGIAGVCRLPAGYVSEDLKWTELRVTKGFSELLAKGFLNRCDTTKWVWICKFLEWNRPENPNQWKAARKVAEAVPQNCSWRIDFLRSFAKSAGDPELKIETVSQTLTELLPKPLPTLELDLDTGTGAVLRTTNGSGHPKAKKPKPSKFCPADFQPSPIALTWAKTRAPDIDIRAETEKFKDWEFKVPRHDWERAWRNWIRGALERSQPKSKGTQWT